MNTGQFYTGLVFLLHVDMSSFWWYCADVMPCCIPILGRDIVPMSGRYEFGYWPDIGPICNVCWYPSMVETCIHRWDFQKSTHRTSHEIDGVIHVYDVNRLLAWGLGSSSLDVVQTYTLEWFIKCNNHVMI